MNTETQNKRNDEIHPFKREKKCVILKKIMSNELRNIIIGISETSTGHSIQKVLRFLRESKATGRKTEKSKLFSKTDEVKFLKDFANKNKFWFSEINENVYIGEGAE
jgi:hypothetical protein